MVGKHYVELLELKYLVTKCDIFIFFKSCTTYVSKSFWNGFEAFGIFWKHLECSRSNWKELLECLLKLSTNLL